MSVINDVMKQIDRIVRQCFKYIRRGPIWFRFIILLIVVLWVSKTFGPSNKEGFSEGFISQQKKFVLKKGDEVYDDFYVSIYDDLTYDQLKNTFEVGEIAKAVKVNPKKSVILDIGSGTGKHCDLMSKTFETSNVYGLDKSTEMVKYSKEQYPEINFKLGDALTAMTYPENTFTLITCLYFTIYNIEDKATFFQNCYNWLMPGGYLAIHLVNRDMFDPILNVADPLQMVSAQKYAKKRITNSYVKFVDFQYKADFKLDKPNNTAVFEEVMIDDKTKKTRKNEHMLYMPTQKDVLSSARNAGFIMKGHIDMVVCQYEYQYIYLLYKPA